jgi:hypothetical protein
MNQYGCKQLKRTIVVGFKALAISFFTDTVEKLVPFQAEAFVQLCLAVQANSGPHVRLPLSNSVVADGAKSALTVFECKNWHSLTI